MNATSRSEKQTVQIPRCEANWIVVVTLSPVVMPVALNRSASLAVTIPIPVSK